MPTQHQDLCTRGCVTMNEWWRNQLPGWGRNSNGNVGCGAGGKSGQVSWSM